MTRICKGCNTVCEVNSVFCPACGTALGATMTQQRTMALSTAQPGKTGVLDMDAIIRRARTTYGTQCILDSTLVNGPGPGELELTDLQLDCSGSMGDEFEAEVRKIDAAARAAINLVLNKYRIDSRDEIGITMFTDKAKCVLELCSVGQNKRQIVASLQSLKAGGGTDIDTPLRMRLGDFQWERAEVVRRIVLLTDGHGGAPKCSADELRRKGVVIDVIAIGPSPDQVNETLLRDVASPGRYRFIKDQKTLVQHYTQLAGKTVTGVS